MPQWEVTEHRTYTVTFVVDADTKALAIQAAGQMSLDEGDEVEGGLDEVEAFEIATQEGA